MTATAIEKSAPKSTRSYAARVTVALAAAGALALTACGSDSGSGFGVPTARQSMSPVVQSSTAPTDTGTPQSTQDTPPPGTEAPSTEAPADPSSTEPSDLPSSDSSSDSGSGGAAAQSLLTTDDIGFGYTQTDSDTNDDPLPCTLDQPGVLTAVPPQDHGQIDFRSPKGDAAITERVVRFASPGDAQRAVDHIHSGYGCDTAVVKGQKLYLVGPTDIRDVLTANLDTADNWDLRTGEVRAELIVVSTGSLVVQMAFVRLSGAQTGDLDPSKILEAGIAKAINGS
ncbi:hypothetical protein [Jatrophihabitans fulvus]